MKDKEEVIILIAEDDDGHAELIDENLREAGLLNPRIRFRDGEEAWSFFEGKRPGERMEKGRPYLLLLDIRMPRMDGLELLRKIKKSKELETLPIIVLTTTDDPREIEECYREGCNFYITKPIDFGRFTETLKRLGLFVKVIRVPPVR